MLLKYTVKPEEDNKLIDLLAELCNDFDNAVNRNPGLSYDIKVDYHKGVIDVKVLDLEERMN